MIIELLVEDEAGNLRRLTLKASQVVVRNNVGTPIMAVAAEYGPPGAQLIATIKDGDFIGALRKLGIFETPRISYVDLPRPAPGARLLAGPTREEGDSGGRRS